MRRIDAEKCPLGGVASNLLSPFMALGCGGSILWCDLCGACGEWYRLVRDRWFEEAGDDGAIEYWTVSEGMYTLLMPDELYRDRCFKGVVDGVIDSLRGYLDVGLTVYNGLVPLLRRRVGYIPCPQLSVR